ncbi:hypothetical protein [Streptomyces guryensis]|nr:hypothetical protein [Streptomyces guryensis]
MSILGIAALAAFTLIQGPSQDSGPSAATDTEKTTAPVLHC